jgi:hypothetical protein
MNIFLGSVLATIGLTIPAMLVIGHLTAHQIILGVETWRSGDAAADLFLSAITFTSGRTNILQGLVHGLLFLAYIVLIFEADISGSSAAFAARPSASDSIPSPSRRSRWRGKVSATE